MLNCIDDVGSLVKFDNKCIVDVGRIADSEDHLNTVYC